MMEDLIENPARRSREPIIGDGETVGSVTEKISSVVLQNGTPRGWWIGFGSTHN